MKRRLSKNFRVDRSRWVSNGLVVQLYRQNNTLTKLSAEGMQMADNGQTGNKGKRQHKATYATDKRKGGYLVRVEGPNAAAFVGREVPVQRKDDSESMEKLTRLIWTGADSESGKPVALYAFEPRPRDAKEEVNF